MKRLQIITGTTFVCSTIVFLLTIVDYLALHDIYKDYVSQEVFTYLNLALPESLPNWTNTAGEWAAVGVSYLARFIFLILNSVLLLQLMRYFRKLQAGQKNA